MKIVPEAAGDGIAVLRLEGRLDAAAAPELQQRVQETLAGRGMDLAIDLSKVSFIDSTGLGTLVSGLKAARRAEGDLRLVAPSPQVQKLLRLTTLDRVFRVVDTLEGA